MSPRPSAASHTPLPYLRPPYGRVGLADLQPGEIVAVSDEGLTVHLCGGTGGEGYLPLTWKRGNEYQLLAGGKATVHRLM